jgi:hypothetical protein
MEKTNFINSLLTALQYSGIIDKCILEKTSVYELSIKKQKFLARSFKKMHPWIHTNDDAILFKINMQILSAISDSKNNVKHYICNNELGDPRNHFAKNEVIYAYE